MRLTPRNNQISCYNNEASHRGVAQLIARSVWDREVEGLSPFTPTNKKDYVRVVSFIYFTLKLYFAYSIARVSRITFILIVPGYCIVLSILLAMSRANLIAERSSIASGVTITRTSRPALMA